MALKSKLKSINIIIDPLNIAAGIEVVQGNLALVFDRDLNTYLPDRGEHGTPLVITPRVFTTDTGNKNSSMNGPQRIINCAWFEGDSPDQIHLIYPSKDYQIFDKDDERLPFALRVNKNLKPGTSLIITAVFKFLDTRNLEEITSQSYVTLYAEDYSASNYHIKINKPDFWNIDPIREKSNSKGEWRHVLSALMYNGIKEVDDSNAAYWWLRLNRGTKLWEDISDVELGCDEEIGLPNVTLGKMYAANGTIQEDATFAISEKIAINKVKNFDIYTTLPGTKVNGALVFFDSKGNYVDNYGSDGGLRENCTLTKPASYVAFTFQQPINNKNPFFIRDHDTGNILFKPRFKEEVISGKNKKNLVIDARFFNEATLRCIAYFYVGNPPSVPPSSSIQDLTSISVEYPGTLNVDIEQRAGAKVGSTLITPVSYRCIIYDNKMEIPDNKYDLFEISWMVKSGEPGSIDKKIGLGRDIQFIPKDVGFKSGYPLAVYVEVKMFSTFAFYASKEGKAVITPDNKVIVKKLFK